MAIVIKDFAPAAAEKPVLHCAPERAIADILLARYGNFYTPADFVPELYSWSKKPVMKLDLSQVSEYLPPASVYGLVHSHVLEHIPGSLDRIVVSMNRAIASGGFHLFQVPIVSGWYREDMDPNMSGDERTLRFYQDDHLRMFGNQDVEHRLLDLFDGFKKIDLSKHITRERLMDAAIPSMSLQTYNGHTAFLFIKE
jgi:phosphoglycolate phosphatase